MIQCSLKTGALDGLGVDLYVLPLFCDQQPTAAEFEALKAFGLKARFAAGDFKAACGERLLLFRDGGKGITRLLLLGLGEVEAFSGQLWREIAGDLGIWLRSQPFREVVCELPALEGEGPDPQTLATGLGKGIGLGLWAFEKYRETPTPPALKKLGLRLDGARDAKVLAACGRALQITEGANLARELASEPGNVATPSWLAARARSLARGKSSLKAAIYKDADLKKMGCGGILSVGQGSRESSALIALSWSCGKKKAPTVALVGKGVSFDSGGISIKPAAGMENMKYDMCGAAAVLGLMSILDELKPAVNVIGVVASAENMPGGAALKPGDIIRVYNGKSVEVINTDAEGRLLLIDAISWVEKTHKPDAIVDIATLTGGALISLGQEMSIVLGTDPGLQDALIEAGNTSGDLCWPLPLTGNYCKMMKSKVADLRNHPNSRYGQTITAAAFLKEGLAKDTAWAHLDVAGTASREAKREGCQPGATGVGVHLFADLLERIAAGSRA